MFVIEKNILVTTVFPEADHMNVKNLHFVKKISFEMGIWFWPQVIYNPALIGNVNRKPIALPEAKIDPEMSFWGSA